MARQLSKKSARVCGDRIVCESLECRQLLSGVRQMEYLDRGVVAVNKTSTSVYVSWRLLVTDTDAGTVAFNVYRITNSGTPVKRNASPITGTTDFTDSGGGLNEANTNAYYVTAVINNTEQSPSPTYTIPANTPVQQFLNLPLQIPPGGTSPGVSTPTNPNPPFPSHTYTYTANDASTADLDGDGKLEIILKWEPTDEANATTDAIPGPTIIDAYKLDGTRLWRINMGINIRSSAQYQPFLVYDFDGDGKAELVMRTMPGTIDGQGNPVILPGDDPNADYRNLYNGGRVTTGPEYLTVFNGQTGAAMKTVPFLPDRINISSWGDDYGHRGENLLMTVAYLDGVHPSIVVGRGLFPAQTPGHAVRNEITAWDWQGGNLTLRWWFRADQNAQAYGLPDQNTAYIGQGNYEMHVADVDGDGRDEIIFGSMTVDDNGTGLYSTGLGHGDALAVSDMIPSHPGEEVYMPLESPGSNGHITTDVHDAATGAILFDTFTTPVGSTDPDVGRGNAFDIDPRYPGFEVWDSYNPSIYNAGTGTAIQAKPSNMPINFGIWWDADPMRETLDGTTIGDWRITNGVGGRVNYVFAPANVTSNNGTKKDPTLVADLFGDWREEVVWPRSDSTALQIWTTTIPATNRMDTLMEDTQYRESVAWQNVGYNQPTATSFYLGSIESTGTQYPTIPTPNIYIVQASAVGPVPPTGASALAASISQVDVTWNAVPGATSYTIRRGTSSVGPYTAIATGVAGTSYPDTTVFGGTTYYYVVSATSAGGEGGISNQATVTTPAPFTYQAEAGTLGGFAAFDTSLPNFNGSGFVNLNLAGDSLQIDNFYADVGGTTRMRLRYCNGTASQVTIIATVNGVAQAIPLDPTGSAIWSTVDIIANLNARSANSIRLESTSDIAISIDQFQVNVIDTLPPIVSSGSFVFATSHAIQLQFDEDLNNPVSTANLVIHPQSSGSDIVPASVQYDAPSRTLTFLLSVILPDGNYTAVLGSGSVSDLTGHALAGDFSLPFFALAGDANHDRKVDISDLHVLALNYGQTGRDFTQGDFNYDNVVDGADLAILATRWQTSLTPPPPALPAGLTAPVRRTAARVASLI